MAGLRGRQLQPETTQLSGPPGGTVSSLPARVQSECRVWLGRGLLGQCRGCLAASYLSRLGLRAVGAEVCPGPNCAGSLSLGYF